MSASILRTIACRAVSACGILVACSPMPSDVLPDTVAVRVVNPIAWPDGKLLIVSGGLVGRTDVPEVRLDTLRLAVARVDDSTMSADLPDTSGSFALRLLYRGRQRVGSVTLVGFAGHTETVALTGWPHPEAPGSPIVIAATESSLVRLDLRTGAAADLGIRHSGSCAISPGPSYRDSVIVAQALAGTTCESPMGWRVEPSAALVDSFALYPYPADRLWAELAPGIWLRTAHHDLTIYTGGQVTLFEQLEEGERVILSPDRSRAVVLTTNAQNQVPMLLTAAGTVAFRLPLLSTEAVAFAPSGDTIFAAGYTAFTIGQPERLMAVSAATGAVLMQRDDALPQLWDLVLDPDAPWVYGVGAEPADTSGPYWQPVILVFDRHTLQPLGRIRPPPTAACVSGLCGQVGLAIDAGARRAYAFDIEGWGSSFFNTPTTIFSFELVPATQPAEILTP
jgi:hypothetical protein